VDEMGKKYYIKDKKAKSSISNTNRFENSISMRGKSPEEISLELLSGEPDDLSHDFSVK